MLKHFFIFLILFISKWSIAQEADLQWVKQQGGNSYEIVLSITKDAAGNIYTTGYFSTTVDFDPGPGITTLTAVDDEDVFVCKMDSAGHLIWVKQFGGTRYQAGVSIAVDEAGNVYTGGIFFGFVDFDPGPSIYNLSSTGNEDDFICKLNKDGNFIWAAQVGGRFNDRLNSIAIETSGNLLVTGYFEGTGDFNPGPAVTNLTSAGNVDIFVLKLSALNGGFIWVKQFGGISYDAAFSLKLDTSNNIFITGFFLDAIDFNPGTPGALLISKGMDDVFILKLDSDGNFRWVKQMGGTNYDRATAITVDKNGDVIVTGYFDGVADFDPGAASFNLSSFGTDDVFIAKLDSNGIFKWARSIGGVSVQRSLALAVDDSGDIYTTGYFQDATDFDPGTGLFNLNSVALLDIYISKLNAAGDFVFAKQFGGTLAEQGIAIMVDTRKFIYAAGFFQGTADFDPNSGTNNLTTNGGSDIFIMKLQQCPTIASVTLTINTCNNYTLNNQIYTASGNYTQVLYNSIGCDSLITNLQLTITRSITNVNAIICEGQGFFVGGYSQTVSGIYYDTLLNSTGCDSIIATHLTVKPAPVLNLGPDRNLCVGETLQLDPGIFSSYLWHDLSTSQFYTITGTGKYWLTVTGQNQCKATDTVNIVAIDTIPKDFLPSTAQLCIGNSILLSVPGYKNYRWNDFSVKESLIIIKPGEYYLTVTDYNNCIGTDSIHVLRTNCIPISIPNAFSPNNDGVNDLFRPTINQSVQNYQFTIFNRNGQKVFYTNDYRSGWNGKFAGKDQPAGGYVYQINFTNSLDYLSENTGTLLLIR